MGRKVAVGTNLLDLDESEADGMEVIEPGKCRLGLTGYDGAPAEDVPPSRAPVEGHSPVDPFPFLRGKLGVVLALSL